MGKVHLVKSVLPVPNPCNQKNIQETRETFYWSPLTLSPPMAGFLAKQKMFHSTEAVDVKGLYLVKYFLEGV